MTHSTWGEVQNSCFYGPETILKQVVLYGALVGNLDLIINSDSGLLAFSGAPVKELCNKRTNKSSAKENHILLEVVRIQLTIINDSLERKQRIQR